MKKTICLILACVFLSSCSSSNSEGLKPETLTVVSTVFPAYDWIREITKGTEINLCLIPSNGTDIHSYQPSFEDIIKITECDLFVYAKGNEDGWYDGIKIKEKFNIADLYNGDEHVWLSPELAKHSAEQLAEKLKSINSQYSDIYKTNCERYIAKLSELDHEYKNTIENSEKNSIIVADRFPFRHLTDSYNINYYAAFEGCSAENEISFETIAELSEKLNELNLDSVITVEDSDEKIAGALISNSKNKKVKILSLDSMQSVTESEINEGLNYIDVMKKNLQVLKEALN